MKPHLCYFLVVVALSALFGGCSLDASQSASGGDVVISLFEPTDGARYLVGDLVKVRSMIAAPNGASIVDLLVNGDVVRSDHLELALENGTMLQPWQPAKPGAYKLQTRMTTTSGVVLESAIISIQVGPVETGPEIVLTTAAPPPEDTISPTLTPTETPPPTSGPPMVTSNQDANCRNGPGEVYAVIGYLLNGQSSTIVGRNLETTWWVIQRMDGGGTCWIWDGVVTISGDTHAVPVVEPPPTPTPTPTLTPTPEPLAAPEPLSPTGTLYCIDVTGGTTLTWSAVSHSNGIDRYEWELSGPTSESGSTSSTQAATSGLSCAGANYQWRVRAVDGKGNPGPWSNYATFTVP